MIGKSHLLAGFTTVAAAFAATVVAGLLGNPAWAASSNSLPADPAAKGYIGLCNENGANVTGGSIDSTPFVWKAVASTPPPANYQGTGQTAVLGIVQPRPGTVAAEWNGSPLTSASYYQQKATPAVQSTYVDRSLKSFIAQYPPQVDGLYVLRMYFGRLNYGDYSLSYPTTTIQVTGKSWRVVKGGTVDCSKATAVSNEQLTGVASKKATTPRSPSSSQRTVESAHSHVISVPAGSVSSAAASSNSGRSTSPQAQQSINASPASDDSQSSSSSWVVWVLVVIVAALAVALGAVLRTRRSGTSRL